MLSEHPAGGGKLRLPDLLRVMLHQAGGGEVLGKRLRRDGGQAAVHIHERGA